MKGESDSPKSRERNGDAIARSIPEIPTLSSGNRIRFLRRQGLYCFSVSVLCVCVCVDLIEWNKVYGMLLQKLFSEALGDGTMEGFFKLISYYQTQSEPAYCGLATLSMVLNALSIDPGRKWKGILSLSLSNS